MRANLETKIVVLVGILLLMGISAAGFLVMTIEKSSLYSITESSSKVTATIIAKDVQRIMLDGKGEAAKSLIEDLRKTGGIDEISVLNAAGRTAFEAGSEAREKEVMRRMLQTKSAEMRREAKKLVFYEPLLNTDECLACHANESAVLGAVKTSVSIQKEYDDAMRYIALVIAATVIASFLFSLILWGMIRKMVITPVKSLESAALKLSDGDLTFDVKGKGDDEIGRLSGAIRESLASISGILRRVKDVSGRVIHVAEDVEKESRKVADGTHLEAEAINDISASIEEMNAVIAEIAENTDGLAASAEESSASVEEMVTSIGQITASTLDLSEAVESTSSSIEQLSATINEVAGNTGELAAAAGDTQSAIMEISASIKEVEKRAKESAALSDKVKNDAISFGMTSVERTITGMQNIKKAVENTAEFISRLGGRSEEIGQILNVIDGITDQTTLLALNAAILAAQAGEHGQGFSVVADEIKELSDRTSKSTQDIALLIQTVQEEVRGAVAAMDEGLTAVDSGFKVTSEAADALRKIIESTKKSSEMSAAIEHATAEESRAAKLVSDAMERVLSMVEQISKATTEQKKGIQLILKATEKISDVSKHVKTATNEQSLNSRQVSKAVELVSGNSQQISRAAHEQKIGSSQIWKSVEKIKGLPRDNRDRAFRLNQRVKELLKESELVVSEMEKFRFSEDVSMGVLRMGIVPLESPAVMFRRFSPLAEYLGKRLNRKVDLKVAVDFPEAVNDLGRGATQICFMTPSTYIEAHKQHGVRVLVKALKNGKPFQHAVIIAGPQSGINSIEDIRGRSFAFGDFHSTSSHIVPRGMLLDAGIDIKDLQYYNYLGHHDDVVKAVLSGEFDAGGVMESAAAKVRERGLKLIQYSEDIPEFNICVSHDLDQNTVIALKEALISVGNDSTYDAPVLTSINQNYTGFAEAADGDYDGIRNIMTKMGLL